MRLTTLPLRKTLQIRNDRDNILLYIRSKNATTGAVNDLSSYTFTGDVKATREADAAVLCQVTFDNDLPNGIVKGYITNTDANALLTAVADCGKVYADIVRTSSTGWDEALAEYELTVVDVVTAVAVSS